MAGTPFFSIIIPIYNKQAYIAQCLESIYTQTFRDFELILVNDGSTDASLQEIEKYKQAEPTTKVISTPNQGVSRARNLAIDNAKGKYLLFIDSDDRIADDYLRRLHSAVLSLGTDIIVFGLTKSHRNGKTEIIPPPHTDTVLNIDEFKSTFMQDNASGIYGFVANKVVARGLLGEDVRFNPDIKLAEDFDFWLSVYAKTDRVGFFGYNDGYIYNIATSNSSFLEKKIDYITQLYIWIKCYEFLRPLGGENAVLLNQKIASYFRFHFINLAPVTLVGVFKSMRRLSPAIRFAQANGIPAGDLLVRLVYLKLPILTYTALKVRQLILKNKH